MMKILNLFASAGCLLCKFPARQKQVNLLWQWWLDYIVVAEKVEAFPNIFQTSLIEN